MFNSIVDIEVESQVWKQYCQANSQGNVIETELPLEEGALIKVNGVFKRVIAELEGSASDLYFYQIEDP